VRLTYRQRELEARTGQATADMVRAALRRGHSVSKAAKELGISRFTLRAWAASHGINIEEEKARGILAEVA
jgi:transposase-like protein